MFRVLLSIYLLPTNIFAIIVRDPPAPTAEYVYSYNIQDFGTGDSKSQHEIKLGDVVRGGYTVLDPDGNKRTVEYTADAKHGFQAVVHNEPAAVPSHYPLQFQNYKAVKKCHSPVYDISTPVAFSLEKEQNILTYPNYDLKEPKQYFVPGNDIETDSVSPKRGQYFIPENRGYE